MSYGQWMNTETEKFEEAVLEAFPLGWYLWFRGTETWAGPYPTKSRVLEIYGPAAETSRHCRIVQFY